MDTHVACKFDISFKKCVPHIIDFESFSAEVSTTWRELEQINCGKIRNANHLFDAAGRDDPGREVLRAPAGARAAAGADALILHEPCAAPDNRSTQYKVGHG